MSDAIGLYAFFRMPDHPEITSDDVRLAAMDLLARREHSVIELKRKLKRRFGDECAVDDQLAMLAEEGLQSDARFAESFLCQRSGSGYGPVRLKAELRERGLSDEQIEQGLQELVIDWCEVASQVLEKKFGPEPPADVKEKARRLRFMQYRGFYQDHYQPLFPR